MSIPSLAGALAVAAILLAMPVSASHGPVPDQVLECHVDVGLTASNSWTATIAGSQYDLGGCTLGALTARSLVIPTAPADCYIDADLDNDSEADVNIDGPTWLPAGANIVGFCFAGVVDVDLHARAYVQDPRVH